MTSWDAEPATGRAALDASHSWRVRFCAGTGPDVADETGLVHLPLGPAPSDGWPVVTFGHMTTGGSDRSAPSIATGEHPELRRMTQGDAYVSRLLVRGIAVLRPDYAGLGGSGPHPYLIGSSLARSVTALRQESLQRWPLSRRWVSAGHSEGATAAMFAAAGASEGSGLRGVCAFTPVTRMDLTIGLSLRLPVVLPGCEVISALIALMVNGAATTDDQLAALLIDGGLSAEAQKRWPHLETRSLVELCEPDSLGALAPRALLGRRGAEVRHRLMASFRANELADLPLPRDVPLRIDAARYDEVAPFWLTQRLARAQRARGNDVTLTWWSASHSSVLRDDRAAASAAEWTIGRLSS